MVRTRIKVLTLLMALAYAGLLGRLAWLQLLPESHAAYARLAQHRGRAFSSPRRGRILARDGTVLAGNQPVHQLHFVYPRLDPLDEPLSALVDELAKRFEVPPREAIERRILEMAGFEAPGPDTPGTPEDDGAARSSWALLLGGIDRVAAEVLRARWRRCARVLEARVAADGIAEVWVDLRLASQRGSTLERLEALLARHGKAPERGRLARQVAETLEAIGARIERELHRDREDGVPEDRLARKARDLRRRQLDQPWLLAADVPLAVVTKIEYHPAQYEGIQCEDSVRRVYPRGEAFGTLTGWLRRLDADEGELRRLEDDGRLLDAAAVESIEELAERRAGSVRRSDLAGACGLEASYDAALRGLHGMSVISVDRWGRRVDTLEDLPPADGEDVVTSLDPGLQEVVYEALEGRVEPAAPAGSGTAGSAAVMDLATGALLASVGFPGVDPGRMREPGYTGELERRWGGRTRGWFIDRPSSLPLYPGSVFKIVVAAAAMESGRAWKEPFGPELRFPCHHKFELIPALQCDSLHGHTPSRTVDLAEALQHSCNVYFYYVGWKHLGADLLYPWALNFGYGRPTGIDLPESRLGRGVLASPDRAREPWQACHYAIGQGFVEATPLQVLRSVAAIAAGGDRVPRPHLARPEPADKLVLSNPRTVAAIRDGLWRAAHAPQGTASSDALGLRRFNAALKTGTAEVKVGERTLHHGWLVGFAPFEEPRIAFVAVIEHTALHGAEAAGPVVARILERFAEAEPGAYLVRGEGGAR
ncbi:MAG: hypothetical protein HY721_35400 [Planctomycetes bacterium]|nr:hypothetical protein [Planctomycetota bacterium]